MIVVGIDPGVARVGYGVLERTNRNPTPLTYGCIETKSGQRQSLRLRECYEGISQVLDEYSPACVAVEKLFFSKNTTSAMQVSEARGVLLLAAEERDIPIAEYTPNQIKQAVTGSGRADKQQVQEMMRRLLRLQEIPARTMPQTVLQSPSATYTRCDNMIAHLSGVLASTGDRWVVIDVGGIGYRVQVTGPALQSIRETEGLIKVHTHMAVRDDDIQLYGFLHQSELDLFRILISVSGIGPQIAMNILSQISLADFAIAIVNDDEKVLTKISGIGQKSAKRLILELKDKMKNHTATVPATRRTAEAGDAVSALISLGFSPREAQEAVDAVQPLPEPTVQNLIRAALARLREH